MSIRRRAIVPIILAAGFGAAMVSTPAALAATSAPVSVMCTGVDGDVAGAVSGSNKSSKEILGLAGSLVGLTDLPPFPTTVTTDAPDKLAVNSGDREVTLNYEILVPSQIASLLRDNLGVQTIIAQQAVVGVAVSGPVTATVTAVAPDTTLDLNNPASAITVSLKVTVATGQAGRIFFRPTPITMKLLVNGSVSGIATVGTVTLGCNAQGVLASTAVQVKGTPSTPAVVNGPEVQGGQTAFIPLLGRSDFLPDDGNPILPDSLRITKAVGGATIENGTLVQPTTAEGGTYVNEVELCGAPRMTAAIPGINEIQKLAFPSKYPVKSGLELFNPHPLGMRLSFKGEETPEIPLTTLYGTGLEYFGQFEAPGPYVIQKALEALPSVDKGDIKVEVEDDGSYTFTFAKKLGESDQPKITLADWRTQLDYSVYDSIKSAIGGLSGGGSGGNGGGDTGTVTVPDPGATDLTVDELTAALQAGQITLEAYLAKLGSAVKNSVIKALPIAQILETLEQLFPQKPVMSYPQDGESATPAESTGPLCTNFLVQTVATPSKVVVAKSERAAGPCRISGRTVKKRVAVRRTVAGHRRTTYKTVKVVRTVRTGLCPQALVRRGGKITVSNLPVRSSNIRKPAKKVTITVTAKGVKGKATKTLTISRKTASASGVIEMPAAFAAAERLTVRISGTGVAKQTRTLLTS